MSERSVEVYLEIGTKRAFASALDWPGWSRGARDADGALRALAVYGPRYAAVVNRAAPEFVAPADASSFRVVGRLRGNSGTDFGVPSLALAADSRRLGQTELDKLELILRACWAAFDQAVAAADGLELRKGPRGGGRELPKIISHVIEAEDSYIVQLGSKRPKTATQDATQRAMALRGAIIAALRARARGLELAEPSRVRTPWTPRYFARRTAWHVLDHAWEIEDRAMRPA